MYEYCVNDPVNFVDLSGLQCTITSEEYKKDLQKLTSLYEQLIENTTDYAQREKNGLAVEPYLWHPPTYWEGLDQSVPIMLDGGAVVATYLGQVHVAGGLGVASTLWTLKNDGLGVSVGVSATTTVIGAVSPPYIAIPVALGQFIYDLF